MTTSSPKGHQARTPQRIASRSDVVVERLLDFIAGEGLQAGEALPSIRVLTERFGVATPTLREALRRLEATKVVEIRHGSGVYLRANHDRLLLWNANHRNIKSETVLDMLEARLVIEPRLAELAAARASNAELEKLEETLGKARQQLRHDDAVHGLNMEFHCVIGRSSRNTVLGQTLESYVELYSVEQMTVLSLYDNTLRAEDQDDHGAIFEAIKDHDEAGARELMFEHLSHVKAVTEKRLADLA